MENKTVMQELIDDLVELSDDQNLSDLYRAGVRTAMSRAKGKLEKERKQIINAANTCSNVLIANEIVIEGNQELTVGENYFNQRFNNDN